MATWREALDNVRAGNVALTDNVRFTVGRYNKQDDKMYDIPPAIILEVQTIVGTPDESIITFRDGSIFGFGYTGVDHGQSNHFHNCYTFVNIKGQTVIGQTINGTDYTWYNDVDILNYVTWAPFPGGFEITGDVDRCAMCFGIPSDRNGIIDTSEYFMIYSAYPTHATGIDSWTYNYNNTFYWNYTSEFGLLQTSSHVVDFLAGEQAEPEHFPGDPSGSGGGTGWFISRNDTIDIPPDPTIQAIDFGFVSIYNPPDITTCRAIATWLWSDDFDEAIKLNYVSPFDNIQAIAIVPLYVTSTTAILRVGNVDSGIACPKINSPNQFVHVDCGSVDILEYWGSFLDYNATYSIWLPFIGFRSLKPDDMVNGKLGVYYKVDLLTGNCMCYVWAIKEDGIKHVLYIYTGNVFYNCSFSGANFMAMYNQQLAATTSGISNAVQSIGKALSGDITGAVDLITGQAQAKRQYETAKPDYGRGGSGTGNAGYFGNRKPYIVQCLPIGQPPYNYTELNGVPSQIYAKLSTLSGYTEIDRVIVNTLTCTEDEQKQIVALLKEGVIL